MEAKPPRRTAEVMLPTATERKTCISLHVLTLIRSDEASSHDKNIHGLLLRIYVFSSNN